MKDKHTLIENLDIIKSMRSYTGGDRDNGEHVDSSVIGALTNSAVYFAENGIPQPNFYPFYDASGAQAEWEDAGWYVELDFRPSSVSSVLVFGTDFAKTIRCSFKDVDSALLMMRIIFHGLNEKGGKQHVHC